MFAHVTHGRYERVIAAAEEDNLVIIDREGRRKDPTELSRGAMEQLYLCLRLGLAKEFSRHAESIPLVMDDVLVNFDPERRKATAELLLDFAREHQVLLFTCHPEISAILSELEPTLPIYGIDGKCLSSAPIECGLEGGSRMSGVC